MAKVDDKPVVTQGYTKTQITESKRFTQHSDILNGLLDEGKSYSIQEVEKIVQTFLEKEVK